MSTTISNLVVGRRPQIRSALATLAELHQLDEPVQHAVLPTGFDLLDDVLVGGVRLGEVVLLGGKPGVGKTIASLQWARSMAQRGIVAVYLCYEHDEVTLLTRLLACELGELISTAPLGQSPLRHEELRGRIRDVAAGVITLRDALGSDPLLEDAHRRLAAYADRLVLVTGSGAHTDVNAIRDVTRGFEGQPVALFVDYVQKVPVFPAAATENERVGRVIEDLKQLALDQKLVVVAVAAADQEGLDARRLHLRHFRGSTALAYEADAVVVLNEKLAIVSRAHVAYSPNRADEFHRQVVFSVEKNRNGSPDMHLEFEKDFASYRFHPRGRWIAERLWSEGSIEL
jgi:replicative DNA helicase